MALVMVFMCMGFGFEENGFVFYPWPLHTQNKPKHFVDLKDLAMEAMELEALARASTQ